MAIRMERRIAAGLLVAVLIVTTMAALSYRSTVQSATDVGWLVHTKVVLNRLELLLSLVTDAEAGRRSRTAGLRSDRQ